MKVKSSDDQNSSLPSCLVAWILRTRLELIYAANTTLSLEYFFDFLLFLFAKLKRLRICSLPRMFGHFVSL